MAGVWSSLRICTKVKKVEIKNIEVKNIKAIICDNTGSQTPRFKKASILASQIRAWVIMNQCSNFTKNHD